MWRRDGIVTLLFRGYSKRAKVRAYILHTQYSQSAIGKVQSSMYNGKSRHVHRIQNTIRQLFSIRVISLDCIKSKDNIADLPIKGLNIELVEKSLKGMRLKPITE